MFARCSTSVRPLFDGLFYMCIFVHFLQFLVVRSLQALCNEPCPSRIFCSGFVRVLFALRCNNVATSLQPRCVLVAFHLFPAASLRLQSRISHGFLATSQVETTSSSSRVQELFSLCSLFVRTVPTPLRSCSLLTSLRARYRV